jgi:hypothetical protein
LTASRTLSTTTVITITIQITVGHATVGHHQRFADPGLG